MKKITLLLLLIASLQFTVAQTVLKPGDIAIVQANKNYQSFDFVPLVPITIGTKITFTDMKYSTAQRRFIPFGDPQYTGIHTFTATQNYAAGTVIQSANVSLLESKKMLFSNTQGNTIIAFQQNDTTYVGIGVGGSNITLPKDTTFLTAIGWYKAVNFKAGDCDIPPGLSVANNTVVKFDSTDIYFNKNYYSSIKFDNMGDVSKMEGTAIQLRRRFADNSNFTHSIGVIANTPVPNFNVLAPDIIAPTLLKSYPTQNKINVSPLSSVELEFNEPIIAKKPITVRNTSSDATQYILPTDVIIDGKNATFSYSADLAYATNYSLEIQKGTFTDLDNNPWPTNNDTIITFATSAKRSVIDLNFRNKAKEDLTWTTTKTNTNEWETSLNGYWSFTIDGIPMRYYKSEIVQTANSIPNLNGSGEIWLTNPMVNSRLVVDLTAINNTVTTLRSNLYTNNAPINTLLYSQGNVILSKTINNTTESQLRYTNGENNLGYVKQSMLNEDAVKIDSIVYKGMESVVFAMTIELIDLNAPTVELGSNRTICEGDSVKLDAGFTPGAVYTWNTGATTQKITVKTTDTYSVTVKNTLGQRSDNVLVTVRPTISVSLPDTIHACVGDTVTLTAGTDVTNSYFWSPNGQTTPSIRVTQSGIYHVLVNNGFGGCFSTDSTRVIFSGAKARFFNTPGGIYGANDVRAELYVSNNEGKFTLFRNKEMLDFAEFDSLAAGNYLMKAHFTGYSFVGSNPWMDTYHDGKTEWSKVIPFKLNCNSDTLINFMMARRPSFEFNGTAIINGKVQVSGLPASVIAQKINSITTDCNTKVMLYNGNGNLIATTCPDANGNFSFSNLPAGNYSISIERTGFEVESIFTVTLTNGETISNVNFTINDLTQTIVKDLNSAVHNANYDMLQIIVYPNPLKDKGYVNINLNQPSKATVDIFDIAGKMISSANYSLIQGVNIIDIQTYNLRGIYLLKISTNEGNAFKQLIIQ